MHDLLTQNTPFSGSSERRAGIKTEWQHRKPASQKAHIPKVHFQAAQGDIKAWMHSGNFQRAEFQETNDNTNIMSGVDG